MRGNQSADVTTPSPSTPLATQVITLNITGESQAMSMLVDVPAVDPGTLLGVSALLASVALLASALPARRAIAVEPTEALRAGG